MDSGSIEQMIFWVYLALRRKHSDMTVDKLYELIDAPFLAGTGMTSLFNALSRVNGWDKLPKNAVSPAPPLKS